MSSPTTARRTRTDGDRSRAVILDAAVRLAPVQGLLGLSIAGLANATGMSKSGLFAHFGSKQDLQLAAVEAADRIFADEVIRPSQQSPAGLSRLLATCDNFLTYMQRRPGGCFFAAVTAEIDTHPGPVRDRVAELNRAWNAVLVGSVNDAVDGGELETGADAEQLAFELRALLLMANYLLQVHGDAVVVDRARRGITERLALAAADPAATS